MLRVLLLATKRSYRAEDVVTAAKALGLRLTLATDRCHVLAEAWRDDVITLEKMEDADTVIAAAQAAHRDAPFSLVLGTCDLTSAVSARVARALGLAANPVEAAELARNKARQRTCLQAAGVVVPAHFSVVMVGSDPAALVARVERELKFPVVIKPVLLSGSRGVMRADDAHGLGRAVERLRGILRDPELVVTGEAGHGEFLVEQFIPGMEVAVEGILRNGALEVLAFFDKPDPLDGPFFEETLYVTPSRLPPEIQRRVVTTVEQSASALGLVGGPVHAELRLRPVQGALVPVVIEAAARSIGGLCSRTLTFGTGKSLDQVVLEAGLGLSPTTPSAPGGASGVMMIPIPRAGILHGVTGEEHARQVPGIDDVTITARSGEELVPLPEGSSYLGFIFARGVAPQVVENALRAAHACLRFDIHGKLPVAG